MGRRPSGSGGLSEILLGRPFVNENTLASFRARLEEIRSIMTGDAKDQYKIKKDGSNE